MGLFDTIKDPEALCDNCEAHLEDLQTKDTECLFHTYEVGVPEPALARFKLIRAYTNCDNCGWWTAYEYSTEHDGRLFRYHNPVESRSGCVPSQWRDDLVDSLAARFSSA